jgi:hypothetical protein
MSRCEEGFVRECERRMSYADELTCMDEKGISACK